MKKYLLFIKRIMSFSLCGVLFILCCISKQTFSAEETAVSVSSVAETEGYQRIAGDNNLELYLNTETSDFYVKNLSDGYVWNSTAINSGEDPFAAGIYRTELNSLVSVVYYDEAGVQDYLNSYSSSVMDGNFKIETINNGFRVIYDMDDGILQLPVEVSIKEGSLIVKVLTSQMKAAEGYTIGSISVLPYFAVGKSTDEGYLFVPDGCGGLISFNDDKSGIAAYQKRVYGENITNEDTSLEALEDDTSVTLPVYGIRKNGSAMLCVIEEGASLASINANGAGNTTSYNQVYASYSLYDYMEYSISANSKTIFEEPDGSLCDLTERFYFLSGGEADYSGMARRLRESLIENGTLNEHRAQAAAYMTVWGGITVKRSFFGILTDRVIPLTSTDEIGKITDYAKQLGIESPVVRFMGWNAQELKGKAATDLKVSGAVENGKTSFEDLAASKDFTFVPTVETLLSYTKGNHIFSRFTTPALNLSKVAFTRKKVSPTTVLEYGKATYFLNAGHIEKHLSKISSAAEKRGFTYLGLSDACRYLYEDFGKSTMKRYDMQDIVVNSLDSLAENTRLLFDNPNLYALKYADEVVNIPMRTGGHLLLDREVPFYQILLSGCMRYASTELNYENIDTALLKILETGSMPHYFMYYASESAVKNTEYSELCGGFYEKCLNNLAKIYPAVKEVFDRTEGSAIKSHSCLDEGVYMTLYENGTAVYVNYSAGDYALENGAAIPAGGYRTEVTAD